MARDGSGNYNRPVSDYVYDTVISETDMNTEMDQIAAALTASIAKDGQTPTTAVIPFASGINTDTIVENGSGNGVTVESVLLKDGRVDWAKGGDIASAGTTDISGATGNYVDITGTTTITALGTAPAGAVRILQFDGALTLTHNASSLILPGGINITTAAGDVAVFVSEGSGNWRCAHYLRASFPAVPSAFGARSASSQTNLTTGQDIAFGSEIYDEGGDYNHSTSTFTARYSGPHHFDVAVQLDQIDVDYTSLRLNLVTSNETFELVEISPDHIAGADFTMTLSGAQTVYMDAGDTAVVDVTFAGGAAQMDTASGATYFSGHLVR